MYAESAFLRDARLTTSTLNSSVCSLFGIGSMRAKFKKEQVGPCGHIFGGNIAYLLTLWGCAKCGINQNTKDWGAEVIFKAPAPVDREFTARLTNKTVRACVGDEEFATAEIKTNAQIRSNDLILKPEFDVRLLGSSGVYDNEALIFEAPPTTTWEEKLYYAIAACDWGIWVLGQLQYPEATFITASLHMHFLQRVPEGRISLKVLTEIPKKNDRVEIVTSIIDSSGNAVGTASSTLVNYDRQKGSKKPLPAKVLV